MGLSLEDFTPRGVPGYRCGIALLFTQLDPDDRAVLDKALADPAIQHASVARVLKREGFEINGKPVSALTIGRHRNKACSCAE